jgi:hypothetical protein
MVITAAYMTALQRSTKTGIQWLFKPGDFTQNRITGEIAMFHLHPEKACFGSGAP